MAGEYCLTEALSCPLRRGSPHLCAGPPGHDGNHLCTACGAAWTTPAFTYTTAHRFGGMKRTDDGRYYGTCECGHAEEPVADKDTAWAEIAMHGLNASGGLRDTLIAYRRYFAQFN